jgi:hypothetical protein
VVEKIAGLFQAQVIIDNGGQVLDRVAGVGEEEAIQVVTFALENELQSMLDNRADVRLEVCVGMAHFQRRIPDLHGQSAHGPEDFPGILGRKYTEKIPAMAFLLLL